MTLPTVFWDARFCRGLCFSVVCLLMSLVGCSDDSSSPADAAVGSDSTLWPCKEPGIFCNAHDECAIDPVCGKDGLCHPTKLQDCDDGLSCTADRCGAMGECFHDPQDGMCALLVKDPQGGLSEMKCFSANEDSPDDPCKVCDPTQENSQWSRANGGSCDDGKLCTKDDTCRDGICKGTYYGDACSDHLDCTDEVCDGLGGCTHTFRVDYCYIDQVCVKDQLPDLTGCKICDATRDSKSWTPLADVCQIGVGCQRAGETDVTGCGVCDPKVSTSVWTPAKNKCFIDGNCYASDIADDTGCGVCTPSKDQHAWTLLAGKCLIAGQCVSDGAVSLSGCAKCDASESPTAWIMVPGATKQEWGFEGSLEGFVADPAVKGVGWRSSTTRAKTGTGCLAYSDAFGASYDTDEQTVGSVSSPVVTLPAGQKAALRFWLYQDTEADPTHDILTVKVGSTVVWSKTAQTLPASNLKKWVLVEANLSLFAGQSIAVTLAFDSVDSWANSGQGVFVDDLEILTQCGL
jgi:hypothetical protein